jgi:hypothetical protein
MVAIAAAVAVDRYLLNAERQRIAAQIPEADRISLSPPDPERWRPTLFAAGTEAPSFDLMDVRTEERVRLDQLRGRRPVVLLFGSFGCNVFSGQLRSLLRLHEAYQDRAAFCFIAIKDAGHPLPEMALEDPSLDLTDPETRACYVRKGLDAYKVPFPCLLDEDGQAERAYHAFPQRLVIVGIDGNIVYDGGFGAQGGPSAWDLKAVESHLREALESSVF